MNYIIMKKIKNNYTEKILLNFEINNKQNEINFKIIQIILIRFIIKLLMKI